MTPGPAFYRGLAFGGLLALALWTVMFTILAYLMPPGG